MKIEDIGFIISIKKFEENSLLIKILSKENGIISGYIKHGKKQNQQIANLVKFSWVARSVNNLGTISIELIKSYSSIFIFDKFNLNLMNLIMCLMNNLLYEKFVENDLFYRLELVFGLIQKNSEKLIIFREYLLFENTVLNIIGSGIIFDNKESFEKLYYISPKTGLAVSKEKGEPYKDKLFIFPLIFNKNDFEKCDILECFNIINFFLKKYLNENNYNSKNSILLILKENLIQNI